MDKDTGAIFEPIKQGKNFSKHEASFRDFTAFLVIGEAIKAARARRPPADTPGPVIPPAPLTSFDDIRESLPPSTAPASFIPGKIGIIGAGAAGLYAAMILQSLKIDYEILEAGDRIGGRLFTHRFNGSQGVHAAVGTPERYDYFDVGAMRFPRIPFMDRVFDLFRRLPLQGQGLVIDYNFSAPNNLLYFNGVHPPLNPSVSGSDNDDYFHVSVSRGGAVPNRFAAYPAKYWTEKVYHYWRSLFAPMDNAKLTPAQRNDIFQSAWRTLSAKDHHTTRSIMSQGQPAVTDADGNVIAQAVEPFPAEVVDWLETFTSGTGNFNLSFIETVISSLDFDWPFPVMGNQEPSNGIEWKCIDGGADHIARQMANSLNVPPLTRRRVTKMAALTKTGDIAVTVFGEDAPRKYSQVISTVPLGCLSGIDVEQCELSYGQRLAIRSLNVAPSTKIGIKFASRWWEDAQVMGNATIMGGQSSTDAPIRCCVYPSYGVSCPGAPGVLLASYSWSQDALRLGALASGSREDQEVLLQLTLDNLSRLHNIPRERFGPVLDFFAYNWYTDPHARGAFAHFVPNQFGRHGDSYSLLASVKVPAANGRLHFAGEATSVHHAWVLGALNSAWRAVYNALENYPDGKTKQQELIALWGTPDEENVTHLRWLNHFAKHGWL